MLRCSHRNTDTGECCFEASNLELGYCVLDFLKAGIIIFWTRGWSCMVVLAFYLFRRIIIFQMITRCWKGMNLALERIKGSVLTWSFIQKFTCFKWESNGIKRSVYLSLVRSFDMYQNAAIWCNMTKWWYFFNHDGLMQPDTALNMFPVHIKRMLNILICECCAKRTISKNVTKKKKALYIS